MSSENRINWYRPPIDKETLSKLTVRNNRKAWMQTLGYLAVLCATGTAAVWAQFIWPWWAVLLLLFAHGTVAAFLINGMHELSHTTVFTSKTVNLFFCYLFSFFGWFNPVVLRKSHMRHHQYTLHPPRDLEETPLKYPTARQFLRTCFDPAGFLKMVRLTVRHACGRMNSGWEETLFPTPQERVDVVRWARILLAGHAAVILVSIISGVWMAAVVISLTPIYGGLLQSLCNQTQHSGCPGDLDDWRVVARSIRLDPLTRFLYWHMNYHIEHHMFAAVPCYNLKALHKQIENNLPAPPGLIEAWKTIGIPR